MNNEQILKKAIEKAIKNGYKPDGLLGAVLRGEIGVGLNPNVYLHLTREPAGYYNIIFSHDFAKAFWGYGRESGYAKKINTKKEDWRYHLKAMVLVEDKLKYIEKFL